ncbi:MAG: RNA polymerase sigma factor [Solirubrobacterales bacterium]
MHPPDTRSSERERFERLFRDHYGDLLAFAHRRTRDRELARDVVASTFLVAWRRRDNLPEDELPWLYGVARNEAATHLRSRGRAAELLTRLRGSSVGAGPQVEVDNSVAQGLAEAFNDLGPRDREVLSLHAWEGLGRGRAASALGCSINAYTIRLHRARRRLAERLRNAEQSGEINPVAPRTGDTNAC